MPDDVKEMLGLPIQRKKKTLRASSEPRSPRNLRTPQQSPSKKRPVEKQKSKQDIFAPVSVSEKFAQQEKRQQMDAFFAKSKKEGDSKKISVSKEKEGDSATDVIPPPAATSGKLDLADVIIAAAAAKTVKLKGKGGIGSKEQ